MGCRHSSSPPGSPKIRIQNGGPIGLKNKISIQRLQKINQQKSNGIKLVTTNKTSPSLLTASNLEQILDGHGKNLIKRFEFDLACLIYDLSSTHILLLDARQLRLINIKTSDTNTYFLPIDNMNIQEIAWSAQLNVFLILTTDRLYQTGTDQLQLQPIHQIQFSADGHRKSYMTVNGDDLIINRSFGYDLRRYSLANFTLIQSPRVYVESKGLCVTTIGLDSNKILSLAISIDDKQMIDLININTNQFIRRIKFDTNENILYPIDLHFNGLWFAKTCIPYVNIGHCLISSDGQITRLKLFSNQDNFIRSLKISYDKKWLLVGRQHALEVYSLFNSVMFS